MKSSSAAVAAGGGGSSGKAAGGSNRRGSVGAGDNANNTNNTTNNQFAGTTTAIKTAIKTKNVISPDRFGLTDDFDFGGVGGDFEYDTVEERELKELERKLNDEVEEDLFEEPRRFNTLHRVIDVLGLQMIDDAATISGGLLPQKHSSNKNNNLDKNPAYRNLKAQQQIVEGAIEHMAVIHCADLNGSVIQVGRVARQFSDAVSKVRHLRKQVRDIQDTLGAAKDGTGGATTTTTLEGDKISSSGGGGGGGKTSRTQNAAAMSLRELWLKKLECEAVLGLLGRLDVIRAAPAHFDQLVSAPCRIGAAVLTLSRALSTMFSDDIAQVQALHKIMEQLLLRKQKAEEIVWDTVADVIYLRTGNGLLVQPQYRNTIHGQHQQTYSGHSVSSESKRSTAGRSHHSLHHVRTATASGTASVVSSSASLSGIVNPFMGNHKRSYGIQEEDGAANHDDDDDDDSVDSNHSGASLFSLEDVDTETDAGTKTVVSETSSFEANKRMMIPIPILEAELDLEADERRCLEEIALSGMAVSGRQRRTLPRYADPVLALRILVECLAQLGRLDDVERVISEGLNLELRQIVQQEQVRMFQRLEKKRGQVGSRSAARSENFKDFRRHLTGLLSSFGCVMVRLTHLAEVLRIRVSSDKELLQKVDSPSSLMRTVITAASEIMQREIKEFLKACLKESETSVKDILEATMGENAKVYENGLFSLGIADTGPRQQVAATATRSNVMEMSTNKFVSTVLFPKTKSTPQVRHALSFRRSVARWTSEVGALQIELATLTGEDKSAPSYQSREQTAIGYLDDVIQHSLLPVLQEEAVNGTVRALERREAFDPVLGRGLYATANSNEPQDVDMCLACQAMYNSTGPLFLALHRLPRGGEMYMPLVAVLEHVMLTFISRVKQQVAKVCEKKTADALLLQEGKGASLVSIMERRNPCSLLALAYSDGDVLESSTNEGVSKQRSGLSPLAPPETDTVSRLSTLTPKKNEPGFEDVGDGVEAEENLLVMELQYLQKLFDFDSTGQAIKIIVSSDEELMRAACLAHSLLKLASLLENRIRIRGTATFNRTLTSTRTLREAIKTIKENGTKMAKFCRLDMLMQVSTRMAMVAQSSTLVARDAVRIPSTVNDLGEYLTGSGDNLREAAGNAVAAYTFSSLEQYIPFCLVQTVRVIAAGHGVVTKSPLTMNGIEALDRSGSVLYRDLKGATSFDNSSWDMELAAVSFERSASFMAMMELEMDELVAYYSANRDEFSEEDFTLMFSMTGPRRRGDIGRYHMTKKSLE